MDKIDTLFNNIEPELRNQIGLPSDLLDQLDHFIALVDDSSQILYLNKKAREIFILGYPEYKSYLMNDYLVDGAKVWKFFKDHCYIPSQKVNNYPIKFINSLNEEVKMGISCQLLEGNNSVYLLQSADEIKSDNYYEKNFEFKLLDKFAESIANELLNPANIISGRLQLLHHQLNEENQQNKTLLTLEKQINRINETVSKLLTFSRLKLDSVPQKIHVNEILQRILLDPSIIRHLEKDETHMEFKLGNNMKLLQGIISHYDLLFKTVLDLAFYCLGLRGKIVVETAVEEKLQNKNWVKVIFTLNYSVSVFGSKTTLYSYLHNEPGSNNFQSIEKAMIMSIVSTYNGTYKINQVNNSSEILTFLFPVQENSKSVRRLK